MLWADIILISLAAAAAIASVIIRSPRPFHDAPRHVLICVAHSDDCVILGAEYAYGAIQHGLSVRIVYLTCSGPCPDAEIAQMRRAEALAAWSAFGVPNDKLTFANLSQSSVEGPAKYTERDIERARETVKAIILSLPRNAALIVPAAGESHVDHKTVRRVSLQALVDSRREDVTVYEGPEYNALLSLLHSPKKTIRTILRKLPLLTRLIKPFAGSPSYVNGPAGFVFRDTPARLKKKKELLMHFASQDGQQLLRFFGYETPYRRLAPSDYLREPRRGWRIRAFDGSCDASALALVLVLIAVAFLTAHEIAKGVTLALSPTLPADKPLLLFGIAFAAFFLVRKVRQVSSMETLSFAMAATLGLIFGAL